MKRWWCMDCHSAVELDKHGRCESCDSEAVDSVERSRKLTERVSMVKSHVTSVPSGA